IPSFAPASAAMVSSLFASASAKPAWWMNCTHCIYVWYEAHLPLPFGRGEGRGEGFFPVCGKRAGIPKGFCNKAQGCEQRATLGNLGRPPCQPRRGCANSSDDFPIRRNCGGVIHINGTIPSELRRIRGRYYS